MRFAIPVSQVEFDEGGNTLWVHSVNGATILRLKTRGKIVVRENCENICTHADLIIPDDIEICLVKEDLKRPGVPEYQALLRRILENLPEYLDARDEAEECSDCGTEEETEKARAHVMATENLVRLDLREIRALFPKEMDNE